MISAGFTLPYWLLKAIILTGINCRDEIFMIRNVHISALAVPRGTGAGFVWCPFFLFAAPFSVPISFRLLSSNSSRLSIAFSPAGVAAQPSPKIFAIILAAICSFATCPGGICGKRNLKTGFNFLDNPAITPPLSAIRISPIQKDITPVIVMQSVTASFAESSTAPVTAGIVPWNAENMTPDKIINAHK